MVWVVEAHSAAATGRNSMAKAKAQWGCHSRLSVTATAATIATHGDRSVPELNVAIRAGSRATFGDRVTELATTRVVPSITVSSLQIRRMSVFATGVAARR